MPTIVNEEPTTAEAAARTRQQADNQPALHLVEQWLADDDPQNVAEQRETFAYLRQALDEDRLSGRKLFPGESPE